MPVPLALLAPLLIGGGIAAQEVSSRLADERIRQRNAENDALMLAMSRGEDLDRTKKTLEVTGQVTPQAPKVTPSTAGIMTKEQIPPKEETEIEKEVEYIGQDLPPRFIKTYHQNRAKGTLSATYTENIERYKMLQERQFASDLESLYKKYKQEGYSNQEARTKAWIGSAKAHGMHGSYSDFKLAFPNMTENERFSIARTEALSRVVNGQNFEDIRSYITTKFPEISSADIQRIAQDIYLLRKGTYIGHARDVMEEKGFTGSALNIEADIYAGKLAIEGTGLDIYLPQKVQDQLKGDPTRVKDLPEGPAKMRLMAEKGKNAYVEGGEVRRVQEGLAEEHLKQIRGETLARERGKAGSQAEQIKGNVKDLAQIAIQLNTKKGWYEVGKRRLGLPLWAALQEDPFSSEMIELDLGQFGGKKMVNIGVGAAAYLHSMQAFLGTMARVFSGERGVLTEKDIDRIKKGLARLGDDADLTKFKYGKLLEHLKDIQRRAGLLKEGERDPDALSFAEAEKLLKITGDDIIGVSPMGELKGMFGNKKEKK